MECNFTNQISNYSHHNDDVLKIAQILTIDDSLGLQLSADLIHFIRTMDYNKIEMVIILLGLLNISIWEWRISN